MTMNWGTDPFLIQFDEDEPSNIVDEALEVLKQSGRIETEETIVLVTEVKVKDNMVATIQMKEVE